jgi:hypothetical protein
LRPAAAPRQLHPPVRQLSHRSSSWTLSEHGQQAASIEPR